MEGGGKGSGGDWSGGDGIEGERWKDGVWKVEEIGVEGRGYKGRDGGMGGCRRPSPERSDEPVLKSEISAEGTSQAGKRIHSSPLAKIRLLIDRENSIALYAGEFTAGFCSKRLPQQLILALTCRGLKPNVTVTGQGSSYGLHTNTVVASQQSKMPRSGRNARALFSVEDAREAVLDSDSDNEFDRISVNLSSDEDYSDVESIRDRQQYFDTDMALDEIYEEEDAIPDSAADGESADATGAATGAQPAAPGSVPGANRAKRRRVEVEYSWTDNPADRAQDFPFTGTPGVNPALGLSESSTPLDCYLKFISNETFERVAEESNRYAESCLKENPPSPTSPAKKWSKTSAGELIIFWALCMLMGVVGKPLIQLYWSTRQSIQTPFFGQIMTRDRFQLLLRFLHFNNNDEAKERDDPNYDPLFKLRPFYNAVTKAFSTVFTPWRSIAIDEALIRFYGRLSFKTYNPRKPAKYGMKAYKICDPSGYTWNFRLYTGKNSEGIIQLVLGMMSSLLDKGYRLFMDNWYTSPALFTELFKRKTHACGTVRMNRKGIPKDLKPNRKLKRGESFFKRCKELLVMLWHDKRDVTMLSTIHSSSFSDTQKRDRVTGEPIQKPDIVLDYNSYMGGVDLSDFLTNQYADMRKSLKWYKKLIFHLNDLAVTNAYIVYCHLVDKRVDHLTFVLDLIDEMIAHGNLLSQDRPKPSRAGRRSDKENLFRLEYSQSQHWPVYVPPTNNTNDPTRPCVVCKPASTGRRKLLGEHIPRPETRYMCRKCKVPLHPVCFESYHTRANFRSG
ncbi:piggyBac transposable element-derived protein 4-like [Diadema antillarum]|uniref:piggyBac transposable element-derived protein 4-like n=1 Tax=Diadema antillarum TaxID=105358 RepID=UPI003A877BD1